MKKVSEELDYFGYEEQKGFYPLREAISKYVKSFGIHVSPGSILIVSGALQALQLISIGLCIENQLFYLNNLLTYIHFMYFNQQILIYLVYLWILTVYYLTNY